MTNIPISHAERTAAQQNGDPLYAAGRVEGLRQGQIEATKRCIRTLMRNLDRSLEEVMALLEIPTKERKIYRKIFQAQK